MAVRIDETLLASFDAAARHAGQTRSEAVRDALELWLRARALAEKVRRHREGYARHPAGADEFGPLLEAQTWPK